MNRALSIAGGGVLGVFLAVVNFAPRLEDVAFWVAFVLLLAPVSFVFVAATHQQPATRARTRKAVTRKNAKILMGRM